MCFYISSGAPWPQLVLVQECVAVNHCRSFIWLGIESCCCCWPGDLHPPHRDTSSTHCHHDNCDKHPVHGRSFSPVYDWFILINIVQQTSRFSSVNLSQQFGECRLLFLMAWENWVSIPTEIVKTCGYIFDISYFIAADKMSHFQFSWTCLQYTSPRQTHRSGDTVIIMRCAGVQGLA